VSDTFKNFKTAKGFRKLHFVDFIPDFIFPSFRVTLKQIKTSTSENLLEGKLLLPFHLAPGV
jgi:hypothetical protein